MRTGSIGGRSVDDLIGTIGEDKRLLVLDIRSKLLALGFEEEVDYDPINVESVIIFSREGKQRFRLKYKWAVKTFFIIHSEEEKHKIQEKFPELSEENRIETNDADGSRWLELDPLTEKDLIVSIAESNLQSRDQPRINP